MVFKRFSFIKGREFYQQTKEHFILQFIRKVGDKIGRAHV